MRKRTEAYPCGRRPLVQHGLRSFRALAMLLAFVHGTAAIAGGVCRPPGAAGAGFHGAGFVPSLVIGLLGAAAGVRDILSDRGASADPENDCMPTEPASAPGPGLPQLVGNPVDVTSGTKFDRAVDAYFAYEGPWPALSPGQPPELLFSRTYSSAGGGSEAFGPGWQHGFETRLHLGRDPQGRPQPQVLQADGRLVPFAPQARVQAGLRRHEALRHEDGVLDRLQIAADAASAAAWIWRWRDGRTLEFARDGRLLAIAAGRSARLTLEYSPGSGRLAAVRDAQGRGLQLNYAVDVDPKGATVGRRPASELHATAAMRLTSLRLPDGSLVRYGYDQHGRLARVRHPGGEEVRYHYDLQSGARLAAVSLPDGRTSEYRYDAAGRVVYTRAAGAGVEQALQLDYLGPGDDGRSGQTHVSRAGALLASYEWRVLEDGETRAVVGAVGPGCSDCPPTGVAYRYANGRLAEFEANGRRWRMVRDRKGRLVELESGEPGGGVDRQAALSLEWAPDDVVDRPLCVRRPSVVAGRTHAMCFEYAEGAVLRAVRESGFAPTITAEAGGVAKASAGTAIQRVLRPNDAEGIAAVFEAGGAMQVPEGAQREAAGRWSVRAGNGTLTRYWLDDLGRTVAVASPDSGLTRWWRDGTGQLTEAHAADGAIARLRRDANGRPAEHTVLREGAAPVTTRFRYVDGKPAAVLHPGQDEFYAYDARGRLVLRSVRLRLVSGRIAELQTRYRYHGADTRPSAWSLPDGSWVAAAHDPLGRQTALDRVSIDGAHRIALITSADWRPDGLQGVTYGNGVRFHSHRGPGGRPAHICHASAQAPENHCDLVDHRLFFDARGPLLEWMNDHFRNFNVYDGAGRLVQTLARAGESETVWRYAYDENGNRRRAGHLRSELVAGAAQTVGTSAPLGLRSSTTSFPSPEFVMRASNRGLVRETTGRAESLSEARWDSAGRLVDDGRRQYRWNSRGLLEEVVGPHGLLAAYRYDHRGQRVAAWSGGRWRHFLFDEHRRPLGEFDEKGRLLRQYIHFADRPLAVIEQHGDSERIAFLHLDHRGAPVLATGAEGAPVWRAVYAPFGRVLDTSAQQGFELALRLPGQHEDAATGLYYNDHRWYDPDAGRYLSPDPLGLRGGPNPYAYAGNDPLTRIDPSGLLLFAFDGTSNSNLPPGRDDWSNVYKLARTYADGRVWYMAGVGTKDAASGIHGGLVDVVDARSARSRVNYLLGELTRVAALPESAGQWLNVDVIGFSRGASMARDFANRVADRTASGTWARLGTCVRLRFLGLWDTVAQFGLGGILEVGWRLAVPSDVAYAAHAVALNEHRMLYPVESIEGAPAGGVRIERGFIGAHSDIGGSYAEGDLSDVALGWMHAQAGLAGVRMFALTSEFARVTSPLLHNSNSGRFGDREFRLRNTWGITTLSYVQRMAPVGGMRWRDTDGFIHAYDAAQPDAYGDPTLVGTVGMSAYANWLASNYGFVVGWVP